MGKPSCSEPTQAKPPPAAIMAKGGVVPALEHEDAGVTFARVAVFVGLGINLVKHRVAPRLLR